MNEQNKKASNWLEKNLFSDNMSNFIEYMEGHENSNLFNITDDLSKYNPDDLLNELTGLIDVNAPENDQVHISNVPGHEDNLRYSYGSLVADLLNSSEQIMPDGTKKWVPKFYDKPIEEESFTSISTIFKGTSFEKIRDELAEKYKLGRFRIMIQSKHRCMSWHLDSNLRLHYPIKTQKGCFMIVNNEMRHMKRGVCYMVNTREHHTAINASNEIRIHLVANIL